MKDDYLPGGNAINPNGGASVVGVPKISLIAVGFEGTRNTEVFEAENITSFMEKVPKTFEVKLRTTQGEAKKEKIEVRHLEDLDLENITSNSIVLRKQKIEKDFYYNFLKEWRDEKSAFREQIIKIISKKERKDETINALKEIVMALKENESPTSLIDLFRNL